MRKTLPAAGDRGAFLIYEKRTYRKLVKSEDLKHFEVKVKETDLLISADKELRTETEALVKKYRQELENYIQLDPFFQHTFSPYKPPRSAPRIAKAMAEAGRICGVGPMAAVAGALAEFVGKDLLKYGKEVIIENGGDIFLKTAQPRRIAVFAGKSPFSQRVTLEIDPADTPLGVCTSSGTVGPSFSFGLADAVTVISRAACLADAAATAIGNLVSKKADILKGLELAQRLKGIKGVIIIKDDEMGIWGKIKLV